MRGSCGSPPCAAAPTVVVEFINRSKRGENLVSLMAPSLCLVALSRGCRVNNLGAHSPNDIFQSNQYGPRQPPDCVVFGASHLCIA